METKRKIPKLTIMLRGSGKGNSTFYYDAFIDSLETIVDALKDAEKRISGRGRSLVRYKIVHLSQHSPIKIVIQPEFIQTKKLKTPQLELAAPIDTVLENLNLIRTDRTVPADIDYQGMERYIDISNLETVKYVAADGHRIPIDSKLKRNMSIAVGEDEVERDVVVGRLDAINVHRQNRFYIYPVVGPQKLICTFPDELIEKVKAALKRKVEVQGLVKYKDWDLYPYAVEVEEIEEYPEDKDLPDFTTILGLQTTPKQQVDTDDIVGT